MPPILLERGNMYNNLKIKNFKKFENFEVNLSPITIIGGENNSGKSTILDAIFLNCDYLDSSVFLKLINLRTREYAQPLSEYNIWLPLFNGLSLNNPFIIELGDRTLRIEINSNNPDIIISDAQNNNIIKELSFEFTENNKDIKYTGSYKLEKKYNHLDQSQSSLNRIINEELLKPLEFIKVVYIGPNTFMSDNYTAELFSKIELGGKKQELINFLKVIDTSIENITTIIISGRVSLYVYKNNINIPLYSVGDGIKKLLHVALCLIIDPVKILLLDEIENGIHYSAMSKFWEALSTLAKEYECQIIATTHSYELLQNAKEGIENSGRREDLKFIRIEENKAVSFDPENLDFFFEKGWELR